METAGIQTEDDGTPASLSYVFKEEEQMAQVWSANDRAEHEQGVRRLMDSILSLRHDLEGLRYQTDTIWERFITLTLERMQSDRLREFLDEVDLELQDLNLRLVGSDCEIDRLRASLQERRRLLEEKIAVLEPLAHRTSIQNHINMMLSRVQDLEAHVMGKVEPSAPEAAEPPAAGYTSAPGDVLYLRVRLLTTRIAILASNRSNYLRELDTGLSALLPDIERIKTDMCTLLTRMDCIRDLSRYWIAYLNIAQTPKTDN